SSAYFIAVNRYESESISDLDSPLEDAEALKQVLEKYHGFSIYDIHDEAALSNQDQVDASPFHPTSNEILDFLSNINVNDKARVIIYFACHGIAVDSDGSPEGYLLAANASPGQRDTFLKMSDVFEKINL